jgi:hypothetical protein
MGDSVSVFSAHAADYDSQRRRLVPCFDLLYGTAVGPVGLRGGAVRRVLDLGAGTGLMSEAVFARHPGAELAEAGFQDCDCFFKHLHFAVLAGWRASGRELTATQLR